VETRLHGFRLTKGISCSVRHVVNYLYQFNGMTFSFDEHDRMLFAGEKSGKCVGVLITLKSQKRFPEIEKGRTITVHIREAEKGRSAIDFNFFAIDPDTGSGVYQHYRGSYSLRRFGNFLCVLYDDLARTDCSCDTSTFLDRSSGHRLREDRLTFAIVYRREGFEELVRNLDKAAAFEYDIVTQEDMSKELAPLSKFARLERRTMRFERGTKGREILSGLKSLYNMAASKGLFRVIGYDDRGKEL